ncbi:MAG: YCF48-related protein [Bacteroidota bacterium]
MNRIYLLISLSFVLLFGCSPKNKWLLQSDTNLGDLHDVEVIGDQLAYAYGYGTGSVFKTTNGAQSWQKIAQFDSLYFEHIQFVNPEVGWIAGEDGHIYKTTDGGVNWTDQRIEIDTSMGMLLLYALYFYNENEGVTGGISFKRKPRKVSIQYFRTTDGGENWTAEEAPSMLYKLTQVADGTLWASASGAIFTQASVGADWVNRTASVEESLRDIRSFDQNEQTIIAAEFGGGHLLISRDGGDNWQRKKLSNNVFRSIRYLGKNRWIVVGSTNKEKGHVFLSEDNGNTWQALEQDWPDVHRLGLSRRYVWLVGKEGFVARMKR